MRQYDTNDYVSKTKVHGLTSDKTKLPHIYHYLFFNINNSCVVIPRDAFLKLVGICFHFIQQYIFILLAQHICLKFPTLCMPIDIK